MIELGVPDFQTLPFITDDPDRWRAIDQRIHATPFLRSEGTIVTVGAPQRASASLVARCAEICQRFDRFYAGAVAAYFARPELAAEFLPNPLFQPLFDFERETFEAGRTATPISRLDCVLGTDGSLRVIEINPVGVNLMHVRSALYLRRAVERAGSVDGAWALDSLGRAVVDAFDRAYRARQPEPKRRPVIGGVTPSGWFRATHLLYRDLFQRAEWDYVYGGPEALSIDDDGIRVAGQRVDILWPDFLFYMAYQEARYSQTKFPSAIGEYGSTPAQVAAILADPRFFEHLRTRRVVMLSPAASYLALPKSLLAWIHDDERPAPDADRAWLADHVARTYSARDRQRGVLTLAQALDGKDRFLIKPCQYGGSHGVQLGLLADADAWAKAVRDVWDDPTWVLQDYWPPVLGANGDHISVGVQNFGGELGGIYLRTSPSALVSARSSSFVPVTVTP
jgi:hypothetical protein